MNFEVGKSYKFDVLYKMERSIGNRKLRVQDADGSQYECNMYDFQEDDMPSVVWCKWRGRYSKDGLPSLEQDLGKIMMGVFKNGSEYDFRVVSEPKEDYNTLQKYYIIEDTLWGISQRYYSSKEYKSEEILRLKVKNIREEKGYLEFYNKVPTKQMQHRPKVRTVHLRLALLHRVFLRRLCNILPESLVAKVRQWSLRPLLFLHPVTANRI